MDSQNERQLKLIYFNKFRKLLLIQKVEKLKFSVAASFSKHSLLKNFFKSWQRQANRTKETVKMCYEISRRRYSLEKFLTLSQLRQSTLKFIFAVHHHRMKILKKYFAKLTLPKEDARKQ